MANSEKEPVSRSSIRTLHRLVVAQERGKLQEKLHRLKTDHGPLFLSQALLSPVKGRGNETVLERALKICQADYSTLAMRIHEDVSSMVLPSVLAKHFIDMNDPVEFRRLANESHDIRGHKGVLEHAQKNLANYTDLDRSNPSRRSAELLANYAELAYNNCDPITDRSFVKSSLQVRTSSSSIGYSFR